MTFNLEDNFSKKRQRSITHTLRYRFIFSVNNLCKYH